MLKGVLRSPLREARVGLWMLGPARQERQNRKEKEEKGKEKREKGPIRI